MTGSAFAILSRRGTLCLGWLRRINFQPRGRSGGGMVAKRLRATTAGGFMLGEFLRSSWNEKSLKNQ